MHSVQYLLNIKDTNNFSIFKVRICLRHKMLRCISYEIVDKERKEIIYAFLKFQLNYKVVSDFCQQENGQSEF